jgi:hypothetical protein
MSLERATINDHSEPVTILYGTGIERYLESDENVPIPLCTGTGTAGSEVCFISDRTFKSNLDTVPVTSEKYKKEEVEVKCQKYIHYRYDIALSFTGLVKILLVQDETRMHNIKILVQDGTRMHNILRLSRSLVFVGTVKTRCHPATHSLPLLPASVRLRCCQGEPPQRSC